MMGSCLACGGDPLKNCLGDRENCQGFKDDPESECVQWHCNACGGDGGHEEDCKGDRGFSTLTKALGFLREMEWLSCVDYGQGGCFVCGEWESPHKPDCRLAKFLKEEK